MATKSNEGEARPPRAELEAALLHACGTAKRLPRVLGTADLPSKWDRAHRYIDTLLDQLVGL